MSSHNVLSWQAVVIGYDHAAGGWGVPPAGQYDRLFSVRVTIERNL